MATRKQYVKADLVKPTLDMSKLPIDRPVAVYYRQSTNGQIGNVSTTMQQVNLPAYVNSKGWQKADIILIDDDAGVSGTTKIDDREGMSRLFDMITEQAIGAVVVQDEDRLFRDQTQIQVNIFIDACKQAKVWVITPAMEYCFHHSMYGDFHIEMFRQKAKYAADYINTYIMRRLNGAKRLKTLTGVWAGGRITLGYMLNPVHRYEPFPPCKTVLIEWFKLLIKFKGNISATQAHIAKFGPYLPDYEDQAVKALVPKGYVLELHPSLTRGTNGQYFMGNEGLRWLFSNATYLGHWIVKGQIAVRNNHEPLIPEDLFMEAFNLISPISFDGSPNPLYKPYTTRRKPEKENERSIARPLYEGYLRSLNSSGEWADVGITWSTPRSNYSYEFFDRGENYADTKKKFKLWNRRADLVDGYITELLRAKLISMKATDIFKEDDVTKGLAKLEADKKRTRSQLDGVEKDINQNIYNISRVTTPTLIAGMEEQYNNGIKEQQRLLSILANIENDLAKRERVAAVRDEVGYYADNWDKLSIEAKRVAVQYFVDHIDALYQESGQYSELACTIYWRDEQTDQAVVPARDDAWLRSDVVRMLKMVEDGATQIEIMKAFPARKWLQIQMKYDYERGTFPPISPCPASPKETILDYYWRTKQLDSEYTAALTQAIPMWNSEPDEDQPEKVSSYRQDSRQSRRRRPLFRCHAGSF